jgi:hypothetical protein
MRAEREVQSSGSSARRIPWPQVEDGAWSQAMAPVTVAKKYRRFEMAASRVRPDCFNPYDRGISLPIEGAFPWGARAGVGLEGGQRLQLVPPFPWPSDELEVNLTHGALSDLELKLSIKCNDFRCMVPNNFCSISWETTQYGHMAQAWRTPARIPLCPACCSRKQGRQAGGASWKGELEGRHAMPCP